MLRPPKYELGAVVMSKNPTTSGMEEQVRRKLIDAGLKLHKGRSAIQCGFELIKGNHPVLSPNILIKSSKVAVEVDSYYTHGDEVEKDRLRNQLLADVGWTVVRLRLGGLEAIGPHDVLCESAGQTKAAIEALVEAVEDAVAGRPGTIRRVKKAKAPKRIAPKSRLGALAPHKYYENAFYCAWTGTRGDRTQLIVMDSGNYLAADEFGSAPRFVAWLGLAGTPRTKWREPIIELLSKLKVFEAISRYPWGDDLWVGEQADKMVWLDKFNLSAEGFSGSSNLIGADGWNKSEIYAGDQVLTSLHPGAVDAGWPLTELANHTGYRGPYQRYVIQRSGERGGLWATTA